MHGNLNVTSLPALIRRLYAERKSGILHFSCPPGPRRIFFRRGRVARVESDASDRFGEELIETGKIQRAELDAALELATREGASAEDVLVRMNRLTAEESKALKLQRMSAIAHSLFAALEGEFRFEEVEHPLDEDDAFEIPAAQMILDGVRRIADTSQLRNLIGDLRANLRPTASSPLPLFTIKMTPVERSLLKATRERPPFSTERLLSSSGLSEIDALGAAFALISIGLVEVEETPQGRPLDASEVSGTAAEPASEPAAVAAPAVTSMPPRFSRFEVQRILARGSSGEVFRARDPETDRIVVIKVLSSITALAPAARERYLEAFHSELETARQLYHPGIVSILENGLTEEGRPFVVTEYVQGTTLRDLLPSGPLAMKHALELATQVIDALAFAHSRGIVHRRVQPSKVLVTADGRARLMDFGMPRLASAPSSASLPYLAPEEIATGRSDARADIYSFGVVCYRMLTGALPFPEHVTSLLDPPAPLETFGTELPPRLGEIVLRSLARDPSGRFADAGELRRALGSLETKTAPKEPAPVPGSATVAAAVALSPPAAPVTARPSVAPLSAETRAPGPEPAATSSPDPVSATELAEETPPAGAPLAAEPAPALRTPRRRFPRRPPESTSETAGPLQERRHQSRVLSAALFSIAITVAAGATWTLITREEPWKELPSAPAGDVSVTPVPLSPPSEAVLEALLAGPSDEALFADARSVLELGDLEASRSILRELLERNPDFPGARALLERVDAERRKAAERNRRAAAVVPEPAPVVTGPSDADLFSEAENAFARGELAVSKRKLEALLEVRPGFIGAAELMDRIDYRIWTTTLPRSFTARHNHRFGGCDGTLSLTQTGLTFHSTDHEWAWAFDELISLERPDPTNFNLVTSDRDLMGLLSNKRFKFELAQAFGDEDWRYFSKSVTDQTGTRAAEY